MVENKTEVFKDLYFKVKMEHGGTWLIPVWVIAYNRADWYFNNSICNEEKEFKTFQESLMDDTVPLFMEDFSEIIDWALNNMNWSDVCEHAILLKEENEIDMKKEWCNPEEYYVSDECGEKVYKDDFS